MRGNAARALLPAVAVLALAAVVAVAARGSTPSGGTSDRRGPADLVFDTLLTLTLLLFVLAIAFLVYAFIHRKEVGRLRLPERTRPSAVTSLLLLFMVVGVVALLQIRGFFDDDEAEGQPGAAGATGGGAMPPDPGYEPRLAWIPLIVVGALAATAYVAFTVAARRRSAEGPQSSVAATLADVLDDSLDDLRAETDPRRAVIAAYVRLEKVLAAHGLPRRSPETQEEFLARILPELDVDASSIRRLTDLFVWAKYSHHEVRPAMKEEAIAALTTARDDLRAAAAREDEPSVPGFSPVERPV